MKTGKIIAACIGILFLISGISKAVDSYSFTQLFSSYGFNFFGYLSPLISAVEIIIGLCLILFVAPATTSLVTAILTTIFTIAFSYAYFVKGIEDCGCFGKFITGIPPYISFIRNLLIIAGSFWIWKKYKNVSFPSPLGWKKWVIYTLGAFGFCLAGYTVSSPLIKNRAANILKGKMVSETIFSPFQNELKSGKTAIFAFSPKCSHCWNVTENIKGLISSNSLTRVVGVTFESLAPDTALYIKSFNPNFKIQTLPNDNLTAVLSKIPVLIMVENGIVQELYDGMDIPCTQTFRNIEESKKKNK